MEAGTTCATQFFNDHIFARGVRVALYTQSFLAFVPTVFARFDLFFVPALDEPDRRSLGSTAITVLITGCAQVITAIIQAKTVGLDIYHALMILNLNWLVASTAAVESILIGLTPLRFYNPFRFDGSQDYAERAFARILFLQTVHLSLTGGFAAWIFNDKTTYYPGACASQTILWLFGRQIPLTDTVFRRNMFIIHVIATVPPINPALPIVLFLGLASFPAWIFRILSGWRRNLNMHDWLIVAVVLFNSAIIIVTESTIKINQSLMGEEPGWSFGETLALCTLAVPLVQMWNNAKLRKTWHEAGRRRVNRESEVPFARLPSYASDEVGPHRRNISGYSSY